MSTIIEPFRIHSIDSINFTTAEERRAALGRVGGNVFLLDGEEVLIDLLTDSGTGAMSASQWGAMMRGDESYAGSRSFKRFRSVVAELTGYDEIIPTHQGRAAERILFNTILRPGDIVLNNTHFDTTRANVEHEKAEARDLVIPEGLQPENRHPFKGNIDLQRLEETLQREGDRVRLVMVTITNNSGGGQPVSLENLRGVRELCDRFEKPFFLDACRFAENAWFIREREEGEGGRSPREIAREAFSLADGCTMSAKKDGLANIGGFLAMNNRDWAESCRNLLILTEGFPTYGGLAGYDLEAIATGLEEVTDERYLHYRIRSVEYLGRKISEAGVPIIQPTGGHAIYIDARSMLPQIPPLHYPGIALVQELYLSAGIRACEIGSVMFGLQPDGTEKPAPMELVRLAIPRRLYTQSHIDYVAEEIIKVAERAADIRGVRITTPPVPLRHFTAEFGTLRRESI